MGRNCYLCGLEYRAELEDLYLNKKWTIKNIHAYARSKYGISVSYESFKRHFRNHVDYYLDVQKQVDKERAEVIKKYLREDIYIAEKIHDHLEIIESQIRSKVQNGLASPDEEKLVLQWIDSARLTIEQLLKWKEKLSLMETQEDIGKALLKCIEDFPPELVAKFASRWEEHCKQRKIYSEH